MTSIGDPRWLFRYHEDMVDERLRTGTPAPGMTVGDDFMSRLVCEHAPNLYTFPLLSKRFVLFLISAGDAYGVWQSERGDQFGAPELRLREMSPGLEDVIAEILRRHVNPIMRRLFLGCYEVGWISPPFLIRYDTHRQRDMGLHYDGQSEVTLSVPLTSTTDGGWLEFPRQGFDSRAVQPGSAILFPGGPSHPHRALPVERGERRTLTIWTRAEAPD